MEPQAPPVEAYHKLSTVKCKIEGRGIVRDKDGNIKGEVTFQGEATPEQVKEVFGKEV